MSRMGLRRKLNTYTSFVHYIAVYRSTVWLLVYRVDSEYTRQKASDLVFDYFLEQQFKIKKWLFQDCF